MWEARNQPGRQYKLLGMALLFAALSLLCVLRALSEGPNWFLLVLGSAGLVLGLGAGLVALVRSRHRRVVMRVNGSGITWERWSPELIPWEEMTELKVLQVGHVWFLGARLRQPARFPARTLLGTVSGWNRSFFGVDIAFEVENTDRNFDELLQAVAEYNTSRAPFLR